MKDVKQLDGADQKSSGLAVGHVVFVELGSASVWPMRRQKLFAVRTKATLRGLSVIFVRSCVPGLSKVLRLPHIAYISQTLCISGRAVEKTKGCA